MTRSYLMGGMLGDFIHSLVVCKYNYEKFGEKADLYIAEAGDHFSNGLNQTYLELKDVIESQEWINSFGLYQYQHIETNLNLFRNSNLLYRTHWLGIYFNSFLPNEKIPTEYSWIDIPKLDKYKESLVINRSPNRYGPNIQPDTLEKIKSMLPDYDSRFFICYNTAQYEAFELKNEFECIIVNDLFTFFQIIGSCKLFIGNQSAPFAMASAMNAPRVLEIIRPEYHGTLDGVHYLEDSKYYKNFEII